jgi:DNA-directed RNA polymerase sigma subunit (sigma70/sigma32)
VPFFIAMEKTINLKNDQVFRHAVKLNLNRNMATDKFQRAESARESLCDLVIQHKLDAVDLQIIEARNCSPMPTLEEVGQIVGITKQAVCKRVDRFQRLFAGV